MEDTSFKDWQELQEDFEVFTKSEDNPFFKSKFVPLKNILPVVKEKCHKHNFILMQAPGFLEGKGVLQTTITHKSGQTFNGYVALVAKDQNDPQKLGASITYMRRYSLTCMFGLIEDDDDGNTASDNLAKKVAQKFSDDELIDLAKKKMLQCTDCGNIDIKVSKDGRVYCPQAFKDTSHKKDYGFIKSKPF